MFVQPTLTGVGRPLRASPETAIGRQHVECEESLASVRDFPRTSFDVKDFVSGEHGRSQWLSGDPATGESTQRVHIRKGWRAPIGHFSSCVEIFVLKGSLRQGGFVLRDLSYSHIPAGIVTGPWEASEDTVLLWMPDRRVDYDAHSYKDLEQIPENSSYHRATQFHDSMKAYIPSIELNSMAWEQTTFLPPGSARKSLFKCPATGRATWVLGLVPMWIEGNFLASHPTVEEAYMIQGDVKGHWSMHDDPFQRRYAAMEKDGYYWRPAHIPHGPFYSETGALCLFRVKDTLGCHWTLHHPDIAQRTR